MVNDFEDRRAVFFLGRLTHDAGERIDRRPIEIIGRRGCFDALKAFEFIVKRQDAVNVAAVAGEFENVGDVVDLVRGRDRLAIEAVFVLGSFGAFEFPGDRIQDAGIDPLRFERSQRAIVREHRVDFGGGQGRGCVFLLTVTRIRGHADHVARGFASRETAKVDPNRGGMSRRRLHERLGGGGDLFTVLCQQLKIETVPEHARLSRF